MATGKLSIRQKMINMMYLVLLAILALNVSAEVLKAFYTMEVSLEKTGTNIDAKNNFILNSFSMLMKNQPEKTKQWNEKALEGKKITQDYVKYLEDLKRELEEVSGGRTIDDNGKTTEMKFSDNTEKPANLMLNKGKAKELKQKINETRDKLIALVPAEDRNKIKTDMFTLDEGNIKWENLTFEGVPVAAVMATITKLQNDGKNTYADVLNILYSKVGESIAPVDKLFANIVPKAKNIMVGEEFEADIMLSAYDSRQATEIVIDGKTYTNTDGKFNYKLPAGAQGEHTVKGIIKVKERDGVKEYPFNTTYNVFNGSAAVSADNMNVLYVGLENPISISVPGVPTDKVVATISNGTLRKDVDNRYTALVNTKGDVQINVSVRNDDGTVKPFGKYTFRAKNIPGASARLGSLKPAAETKTTLTTMNSLLAVPDFDIGFRNMTYKVTSYSCLIRRRNDVIGPYTINGSLVTQEIKNQINTLKKGDLVVFANIKGKGPVGDIVMDDIVYTIR